MLSAGDQLVYRELQHRCQQVQELATQAHPNAIALKSQFLDLQQFFQLQILSLDNVYEEPLASRVHSLHTEINKQLRLLGVDISFLQAARQATTVQQRQAQIRDRLTILMGYCDVLLTPVVDAD